MDNERLPIKFFAPREIDELRVEGNRNQEPPRWLLTGQDLIDRSTQLLDAFHSFRTSLSNGHHLLSHLSLLQKCVKMLLPNPDAKTL